MIRKSMLLLALCIGTGTVMAQDSDDRDKLQRRLEKYFDNYKVVIFIERGIFQKVICVERHAFWCG